jgi:virulence-associated protein VapD
MIAPNAMKIFVFSIFFIVTGCATGYQPAGVQGGYADLQIASELFRVSFQGNYYTSEEEVRSMALLRAADLAIQYGAPYFQVMPIYSPPNPPFPYAVEGYRATLTIRLMQVPPAPGTEGYNTQLLRGQLRKKYGLD